MNKLLSTLKGKVILGVAVTGIIAVAATVAVLLSKPESYRTFSVEEVVGNCQITSDEGQKNAYEGMHLYSGDDVSVREKSSLTMLLDRDKYVYADENTHFWLSAKGNEKAGQTTIHLEEGSELNWLKTELSEGETYEINTPNSVMAVRGTVFRVTVYYDEDGTAWSEIEVYQGKVEISLQTTDSKLNGVKEIFMEGQAALIRGNEKLSEFVAGDDGRIHRKIDYKNIPKNMTEMLLRCMENGEKLCIEQDLLLDYTELEEHQIESKVIKEPTCTQDGAEERYCAICGELMETRVIAATGHHLGKAEVTKSTCTKKGKSVQRCTNPGCTYEETIELPVIAHVYGAWTVVAEASCTAEGSEMRKCNSCGAVQTRTLVATGHNMGPVEVIPSTCVAKGVSVQKCTSPGCSYAVSEELPLAAHSYGAWTTTKGTSCTTPGSEVRKCSVCGAMEMKTIFATGHNLGSAEVTPSTCTAKGKSVRTCKNSGCSYAVTEELPLAAHQVDETNWIEDKIATCTEAGSRTGVCSVCKGSVTETIPALGHKLGKAEIQRASTCTTRGLSVRTCTNQQCKYEVREELPLAEHQVDEKNWDIKKSPTCTDTGIKVGYCIYPDCNKEMTETIPALGHDWIKDAEHYMEKPGSDQTPDTVEVTAVYECMNKCQTAREEKHTVSYQKENQGYYCNDCKKVVKISFTDTNKP